MKIPQRGKAPIKKIAIPKKELISEHQQLIHTLRNAKKARLNMEARKQAFELKKYKKGKS